MCVCEGGLRVCVCVCVCEGGLSDNYIISSIIM